MTINLITIPLSLRLLVALFLGVFSTSTVAQLFTNHAQCVSAYEQADAEAKRLGLQWDSCIVRMRGHECPCGELTSANIRQRNACQRQIAEMRDAARQRAGQIDAMCRVLASRERQQPPARVPQVRPQSPSYSPPASSYQAPAARYPAPSVSTSGRPARSDAAVVGAILGAIIQGAATGGSTSGESETSEPSAAERDRREQAAREQRERDARAQAYRDDVQRRIANDQARHDQLAALDRKRAAEDAAQRQSLTNPFGADATQSTLNPSGRESPPGASTPATGGGVTADTPNPFVAGAERTTAPGSEGGQSLRGQCEANPGSPLCQSMGDTAMVAMGAYRTIDGGNADEAVARVRRELRDLGYAVTTAPTIGITQTGELPRGQEGYNGWLAAQKRGADGRTTYIFSPEGTADARDWATDASYRPRSVAFDRIDQGIVDCTGLQGQKCYSVHGGFAEHASRLLNDPAFRRQVDAAVSDRNSVIKCTGHSLAAASAAMICAYIAAQHPDRRVEVVGYATPPGFYGDTFERDFAGRITSTNILNPGDPVPTVPGTVGLRRFGRDLMLEAPAAVPNPFATGGVPGVENPLAPHRMSNYLRQAREAQAASTSLVRIPSRP